VAPEQWKPAEAADEPPEGLTLIATQIQSTWRGHSIRADMAAAGLSDCTVPNSQLASLNPGHRQQSAIAQHQPSVGSPKNGDNRLVRCISGK